jgi:UTP--glucose-1-phosphate uridylyltransferase
MSNQTQLNSRSSPTKIIFPCAGGGTRVRPLTVTTPKSLLAIGDRPALHYILAEAAAAGFNEYVMVVGEDSLTAQIRKHFELIFEYSNGARCMKLDAKMWGLDEPIEVIPEQIEYVFQKERYGLGHAILCAKDVVGQEDFAVALGDMMNRPVTNVAGSKPPLFYMKQIFEETGQSIIASMTVNDPRKYGIIESNGDINIKCGYITVNGINYEYCPVEIVVEKPEKTASTSAVFGQYIFENEVMSLLNESFRRGKLLDAQNGQTGVREFNVLTDVLNSRAAKGKLSSYQVINPWHDTGSLSGLMEAQIEFCQAILRSQGKGSK